jgi:hypothetical protein
MSLFFEKENYGIFRFVIVHVEKNAVFKEHCALLGKWINTN